MCFYKKNILKKYIKKIEKKIYYDNSMSINFLSGFGIPNY